MAVWEGPVPPDDAAGLAAFERLHAEAAGFGPGTPTAAIRRYVGTLLERYPDWDEESSDEELASAVWTASPAMAQASGPLFHFGIASGAPDDALEYAVRAALEQGLVVFDPQAGRVVDGPDSYAYPRREDDPPPLRRAPAPMTYGHEIAVWDGPVPGTVRDALVHFSTHVTSRADRLRRTGTLVPNEPTPRIRSFAAALVERFGGPPARWCRRRGLVAAGLRGRRRRVRAPAPGAPAGGRPGVHRGDGRGVLSRRLRPRRGGAARAALTRSYVTGPGWWPGPVYGEGCQSERRGGRT
jgi:hypothetical protein